MSYTSLKYKKIKTKKPHSCFSCLRKVQENSIMVYWAGIYEGGFNSGYTCLTCEEIIAIQTKLKAVEYGVVEMGYVTEMTSKEITPEMLLETLKKQ
jgi:hypothetical protein